MSEYATVTAKVLVASYEVAFLVAQSEKPHTIDESLVHPAAIAMTRAMHSEKIASTLETIPLSMTQCGSILMTWQMTLKTSSWTA